METKEKGPRDEVVRVCLRGCAVWGRLSVRRTGRGGYIGADAGRRAPVGGRARRHGDGSGRGWVGGLRRERRACFGTRRGNAPARWATVLYNFVAVVVAEQGASRELLFFLSLVSFLG